MVSVNYNDLEMAMDFASGGDLIGARAYVCRKTGKIYWESDDAFEEVPADVGDDNLYAEVPDKRDLDLGKSLVMDFVLEFLPGQYETVQSIFRRRGAYSRFKDFLNKNGLLEAWYSFEQSATRKALVEWAEAEGFTVEEASRKSGF